MRDVETVTHLCEHDLVLKGRLLLVQDVKDSKVPLTIKTQFVEDREHPQLFLIRFSVAVGKGVLLVPVHVHWKGEIEVLPEDQDKDLAGFVLD